MKFSLTVKMDNAAFGNNGDRDPDAAGIEMARLLNAVASNLANDGARTGEDGVLFDSNGNMVGGWSIT